MHERSYSCAKIIRALERIGINKENAILLGFIYLLFVTPKDDLENYSTLLIASFAEAMRHTQYSIIPSIEDFDGKE